VVAQVPVAAVVVEAVRLGMLVLRVTPALQLTQRLLTA
jgi:hypothetical protein